MWLSYPTGLNPRSSPQVHENRRKTTHHCVSRSRGQTGPQKDSRTRVLNLTQQGNLKSPVLSPPAAAFPVPHVSVGVAVLTRGQESGSQVEGFAMSHGFNHLTSLGRITKADPKSLKENTKRLRWGHLWAH